MSNLFNIAKKEMYHFFPPFIVILLFWLVSNLAQNGEIIGSEATGKMKVYMAKPSLSSHITLLLVLKLYSISLLSDPHKL